VTGSHKVYILDEAHMLSTQAWNAFLKTLEEPPPNTVFVLATTEANKVLPTVADRCHRFDFQRPSAADVGEVVSRVAVAEGIAAGPEVLSLIARSADGSFRDALGTLEQLVQRQLQALARKQGAKAVNQIRQFPHIAGPLVGLHGVGKVRRKRNGLLSVGCMLLGKETQQQGHIAGALAQLFGDSWAGVANSYNVANVITYNFVCNWIEWSAFVGAA
jgi:hypothetical protein